MSFAPSFAPLATQAHMGLGSKLEHYHPPTNFETFEEGILLENARSFSNDEDLKLNVISWIANYLGIDPSNVEWTSGSSMDGGFSTGHVKQSHDGIPFANAVANVAFMNNKVTSFGHSFVQVDDPKIAKSKPTIASANAIASAEAKLGGNHNGIEPTLQYLARPDNSVSLVYTVHLHKADTAVFLEAYVDGHSGDVLSITDFVSH